MPIRKNSSKKNHESVDPPSASDTTRVRLLNAAIDVFGQRGFEAATTRIIAAAAGANVQAISYYFGSKEGLYMAAADHLSRLAADHWEPVRSRVSSYRDDVRRQGRDLEKKEAVALLEDLAGSLLRSSITTETTTWVRFIVREQAKPTAAFGLIHERLMKPILVLTGQLIAVLTDEDDPSSRYVRLQAVSFIGSLMIFRFANATLHAYIGDPGTDADVMADMHRLVHDLVISLCHGGKTS